MRNKIIQAMLPVLSIAAIIAAAVYIKHTGFDARETEQLLSVPPSVQPAAQSGDGSAIPLNTTVSSLPVPASAPEEITLSPTQMKEDLDELVSTLVQVHPRLIDGWTSEEQLVIDEAYNNIKQTHTLSEFYFIADTIVILLHDGHTTLSPLPGQNTLDLPLFWSREGLVVKDKRGQLQPGDIITAIGGRSIKDLEAELKLTIPAENEDWVKVQATSLLGAEWFLKHLGLVSDNEVAVTAARGSQIITEGIVLSDSAGQKEYNPYPVHNTDFTFEIEKEHSLGIFQLNTCIASEEYKSTVKRFFDEVYSQGITNIAVDLRNNGGGDSRVIEEFLAYTAARQYRTFKSEIRYSPQVKQQIPGSPASGNVVKEAVLANIVPQSEHPFTGDLYVLTSPRTFSSANWFALVVQDNKLGQVLGEATGNQPSSYGNILRFQLPSSGIRFQISSMKFTRPDPARDPAAAVIPDIEAYKHMANLNKACGYAPGRCISASFVWIPIQIYTYSRCLLTGMSKSAGTALRFRELVNLFQRY